jgi:hypothetical protein
VESNRICARCGQPIQSGSEAPVHCWDCIHYRPMGKEQRRLWDQYCDAVLTGEPLPAWSVRGEGR